MINHTAHYEFNKPDGDELVDIAVLNANMDAIDALIWDINQRLGPVSPLPLTWAPEQIIEIPESENATGLYEEQYKLNLVAGNSYKLTIIDKDDQVYYENTVVASEEYDEETGATTVQLDFTISNYFFYYIMVNDGAYLDLSTYDFSTNGFMAQTILYGETTFEDVAEHIKSFTIEEATTPPSQ